MSRRRPKPTPAPNYFSCEEVEPRDLGKLIVADNNACLGDAKKGGSRQQIRGLRTRFREWKKGRRAKRELKRELKRRKKIEKKRRREVERQRNERKRAGGLGNPVSDGCLSEHGSGSESEGEALHSKLREDWSSPNTTNRKTGLAEAKLKWRGWKRERKNRKTLPPKPVRESPPRKKKRKLEKVAAYSSRRSKISAFPSKFKYWIRERFFRSQGRRGSESPLMMASDVQKLAHTISVASMSEKRTIAEHICRRLRDDAKLGDILLRTRVTQVWTSLEEGLCDQHQLALSVLMKTRKPAELLPDFLVLDRGTKNRPKKPAKTAGKGGAQIYWYLKSTLSVAEVDKLISCAVEGPPPTEFCAVCHRGQSDPRLSPQTWRKETSSSNEKLASQNSQAICSLLRSTARRLIGIRLLHHNNASILQSLSESRGSSEENSSRIAIGPSVGHSSFRTISAQEKARSPLISKAFVELCSEGERNERTSTISQFLDQVEDLPENDSCPICADMLVNPSKLACGHIFCRVCLLRIAATCMKKYLDQLCPLCREPYAVQALHIDSASAARLADFYGPRYSERVSKMKPVEVSSANTLNKLIVDHGEEGHVNLEASTGNYRKYLVKIKFLSMLVLLITCVWGLRHKLLSMAT